MRILLDDGTDLEGALRALLAQVAHLEDSDFALMREMSAMSARLDALEGAQEPTPTPDPQPSPHIWLDPARLPRGDSPVWSAVARAAHEYGEPVISERSTHSAYTVALALLAAGSQQPEYYELAVDAIREVIAAPYATNDVLAVCRRLAAYPIAADLIDLPVLEPTLDVELRVWLRGVLTVDFSAGGGGGSVASVHERRPNNFGTHAGASRIACALYLGDREELERAATVFRGWLGDRDAYAGFSYGDLSWQADPDNPVGVNPAGATKEGRNIDGVIPDDQRRSGPFDSAMGPDDVWQPPKENYAWEALQGVMAQAWLLHRAGYDVFEWSDRAVLRAVRWLYHVADYPAEGDDTGTPYLTDHIYGTAYAVDPATPGKNGLGVSYPLIERRI